MFAVRGRYDRVSNFRVQISAFSSHTHTHTQLYITKPYYFDFLHNVYTDYDAVRAYQLFQQQKRPVQQTKQNRNMSLGGTTTMGRILAKLWKMDETGE